MAAAAAQVAASRISPVKISPLPLLALLAVSAVTVSAAPARPNIVYFMADDLGVGDVKCYGSDRCKIETPAFDRLAHEGVKFTDAHASASICVPSRTAIMTGRYQWRFGPGKRGGPWGYLGLRYDTNTFTLGRLMRQAGYRTGYVGKWHLGTEMTTTDGKVQGPENVDYTRPLKVGPGDYGFDESFILPGSLDMFPYAFLRNHAWVGRVTARKGWSAFNRVGPAAEDFEDVNVLDTFSTEVETYIERHAQDARAGRPFFLYFAVTAPHTPISPHPRWEGRSPLGTYGDFVMETDDCLGRLLRALERHGLAGNTLVVATSDHGAASYAGNLRQATFAQYKEMEKLGHHSSGIYRGYKFSAYEGGHRVPFVVRWPGVAKAGAECDRLVALPDVFRTFAEVSGQALTEAQGVDSFSLVPLLQNPRAPATRPTMIQQSARSYAVRRGDWKLLLTPGSGCPGTYGNEPKDDDAYRVALETFGRKAARDELKQAPWVQLFNLRDDPTESNNLAARRPDTVRELFAIFDQEIANGRSTPGPGQANDRPGLNYLAGTPGFVLKRD